MSLAPLALLLLRRFICHEKPERRRQKRTAHRSPRFHKPAVGIKASCQAYLTYLPRYFMRIAAGFSRTL